MKISRHARAFTLIEVMVAIAIFFMAMFAILGVMSAGVHAASLLRSSGPTAGMIAGQMCASNELTEGRFSGTFHDIPIYEAYQWDYQCEAVTTNGLFRLNFTVTDPNGAPSSSLSMLLYRPDSKTGGLGVH